MKNLLLTSFFLLIPANSHSSDRPVKTTVKTAFLGACGAGCGYGLKKIADYSLANYSLATPPVITPTTKSQTLVAGLGILGALLIGEKLYCDETTPFDNVLPDQAVPDKALKREKGKALDLGIKAATAFLLLATAGKQDPIDAALCTAFGLGVLTCLEQD